MLEKKRLYFWLIAVLAVVLLTNLPSHAETGNKGPEVTGIENYVQELMEKADIPGLSLVIVRGDNEIFMNGFGYADLEKKVPVSENTRFELASCSKAFTALAVLQLEEKGQIDLDAPVSNYLPWFYAQYKKQKTPITLRQCLHHTSGIPWKTLSNIPQGDNDEMLQQTVRNMVGIELIDMPGKRFEYATTNYDILGAVIEKISGKSFEVYMESYILKPLGLSHTIVGVDKDNPPPGKAVGYKMGFFASREYDSPVFRGNTPAAYIISNAKDMDRWLRIQMGLVETDFAPLVRKSHTPDLTVPPSRGFASYSMGWWINSYQKGTVSHAGLNPNFTAYISFRPAEKIGVAVLANTNTVYTNFIGSNVLKRLAGEEVDQIYPSESKIDTFCSVMTLVVGIYVLTMLMFIVFRIIGGFRGKIKLDPFSWKKARRLVVTVFLYMPFFYGIYLIPYALADMSWKTALVWAPISFSTFALMLIAALGLSYIHFILTLVFVTQDRYRNEIPLITVISILAGLAGTGMLFLITTSFFSTTPLVYLLYYFGLAYMVHIVGRKIVQTKMIHITNNIALDLRIDLIQKIFSTRYQQFEKIHDGRIFTTLNDDTATLARSASILINFVTNFVTAISTFIYMITISFLATLVVFGVLGLMAVYYILVSKRSRVFMEAARDTANVYMSLLNGLIKGYKELVIHLNKKNEYKEELIDSTKKNCSKSITAAMKFLNADIIGDSIIVVILGVISIVVPRFLTGASVFKMVTFVMVIIYLLGPIRNVLNAIQPVTRLRVSWNRIRGFVRDLDVEKDEKSVKEFVRNIDLPKSQKPMKAEAFSAKDKVIENLKIEGLMFAYEGENGRKGFSVGPIDFEVNKGESLFIIGGNGSGKSTLAKLVTGLYICEGGRIKVNDLEIADTQIGEYFSTIFSNYHLFKRLYDIDLSNKDAYIKEYLKRLNLEDKIHLKNNLYSTLDLSGGQRKRLALFQCYLENRPIFLFDELAADQDPDFRRLFYRELIEEMKKQGKIVIAISHDDHYFDAADKIIKLDMGKVDFFERREEFEKKGGAIWTYNKS
ncbi:MAG: cyclic peptide export ABC transporter [Candidatus Aminicenantes bacterium]